MPNFRTLDLNLLRVFDAVMAEGSLTRAAHGLAMTQPAVSHAVRRLREAVGDELFVRTPHGMRPTARGEALWPQVRGALAALQQALAPGEFDPEHDEALWRLSMADATAALLIPPLVAALTQVRARGSLRVLPLTTRDPRGLLEAGDSDLAVGFFPEALAAIDAQGQDASLRHARLGQTRYVCVMRKRHPLAGRPLTLDNYCAAQHLLVSFSGRPHGLIDQVLATMGRQRRVLLTVNQFFTAGRVVTQSDLLTVLPEGFIESTGFRGQLVTHELPLPLPPVTVEMLWHLRHEPNPAHRWLRSQILAASATAAASA